MITSVGSLWSLWLVVYDHIWNWMAVYKWSHWLSVYYHIVLQFMITLVSSLWSLWLAVYDHRSSLPVQLVPRLRLPLPHTHALSSPALVWTAIISIISIISIIFLLLIIITLVTLFFGSINLFHLPCLCSSPFSKLIFQQCNVGAMCQVSHTCQWRPDEHLQFPGSACCTIPLIQNPLSIPRTPSGEFDQCSEFLVDWSQVLGLTTFFLIELVFVTWDLFPHHFRWETPPWILKVRWTLLRWDTIRQSIANMSKRSCFKFWTSLKATI